MRRSFSGLWLKHWQNKKKQITVFKKWACSPYFSAPQWRRCKGLTHVQTSKIPGWPNSLQKSLTPNVLQNLYLKVFTNCQTMEYRGFLAFVVIFFSLLILIGFSRFASFHPPSFVWPTSSQGNPPSLPWSRGSPSIQPLAQLERDDVAFELDGRNLPSSFLGQLWRLPLGGVPLPYLQQIEVPNTNKLSLIN